MSWQLLGSTGIVLIVAAFVQTGIKAAGVEVGPVRSPVAIGACVIAGFLFLGMGYATWRDRPPTSGRQENAAVLIVDRVMDTIDRLVAAGGGAGRGATTNGVQGPGPQPAGPTVPRNDQTITLSPTSGGAGTRITVTGRGFDGGELVEVSFQAVLEATVSADSSGSFVTTITVPGTMGGFHGVPLTVGASGRSSARSAHATFTVQ